MKYTDRTPLLPVLLAVAAALAPRPASAQWVERPTGTDAEFRGLDSAGELVVWAAGSGGTFSRSLDGGDTWASDSVPGAAGLFFIDVHAVSASTAYLLGTDFNGGLAHIYKTADGGRHWTMQYEREGEGVFLDGMAFWDANRGVAFGDPVDGTLEVVVTRDGGAHWSEIPASNLPAPLEGEAAFAASGRAIAVQDSGRVWLGTGGGRVARVFRSTDYGITWSAVETPLPGGATAGIFGLDFRDPLNGIAVGGDYQKRESGGDNVLRTTDGGLTWTVTGSAAPAGVRYGVAWIPGGGPVAIATGPSGTGISADGGVTWTALGTAGFNTVDFASRSAGWAAGTEGRIARFEPGG